MSSLNLDKYQREAVVTEEKNVLVVAPPGSGKTTVIINRLCHLINERKINPNSIVVITFTRAAAENMKSRYKALNKSHSCPFFGTFHGLFYKILARHMGKINIINSIHTYRIVKEVLVSYLDSVSDEKIKDVINDISLFKNSESEMVYFKPKIDKSVFIECFNAYEEFKKEKGLLDFDDLQLKAKLLFLENPNLLQGYRSLFKYILVDEFQDCDMLQIELLQMLCKDNSIFAVGDEDQCIYGFRGSRPDCMVDFHKFFKEGKKLFLKVNYRSVKNIVNLSKKVIKNNENRNSKIIEGNKIENGAIKINFAEDERQQSNKVVAFINKNIEELDYCYEDFVVLYRTNMESRNIIDTFLKKQIPFRLMDGKYDFFEHFICKDLIAYLKLSIEPEDKESFERIINKPFRYISKTNIQKVVRSNIRDNCFETLKNIEDMPVFQMKSIDDLYKNISKLNKMHLRDALNFIVSNLGYYEYLQSYAERAKIDINELKDVIEEFKDAAFDFNSIITFLVHIEHTKEELKDKVKNGSGVLLSTIHGVKGMEFKNVIMINCNEGNIPHKTSIKASEIEEERRLFYVGVTRAIENLYICAVKKLKGKAVENSRFLTESFEEIKEISLALGEEKNQCHYKNEQEVVHSTYGKGKITEVDKKYVTICFENGIERKFDGFILESSGLIEEIN